MLVIIDNNQSILIVSKYIFWLHSTHLFVNCKVMLLKRNCLRVKHSPSNLYPSHKSIHHIQWSIFWSNFLAFLWIYQNHPWGYIIHMNCGSSDCWINDNVHKINFDVGLWHWIRRSRTDAWRSPSEKLLGPFGIVVWENQWRHHQGLKFTKFHLLTVGACKAECFLPLFECHLGHHLKKTFMSSSWLLQKWPSFWPFFLVKSLLRIKVAKR